MDSVSRRPGVERCDAEFIDGDSWSQGSCQQLVGGADSTGRALIVDGVANDTHREHVVMAVLWGRPRTRREAIAWEGFKPLPTLLLARHGRAAATGCGCENRRWAVKPRSVRG